MKEVKSELNRARILLESELTVNCGIENAALLTQVDSLILNALELIPQTQRVYLVLHTCDAYVCKDWFKDGRKARDYHKQVTCKGDGFYIYDLLDTSSIDFSDDSYGYCVKCGELSQEIDKETGICCECEE